MAAETDPTIPYYLEAPTSIAGAFDTAVRQGIATATKSFVKFPNDIIDSTKYGSNYMVIHINEQKTTSGSYSNAVSGGTPVVDTNGKPTTLGVPSSQTGEYTPRINNSTRRTLTSIALHIPDNITSNFGVSYDGLGLGALGSAMGVLSEQGESGVLTDLRNLAMVSGVQLAGEVLSQGMAGIAGAIFSGSKNSFINNILKGISGGISKEGSDLTGIAKQLAMLKLGIAENPYQELLFKGVNYREFNFVYKLMPTSATESNQISEIINLLKFHMHPEVSSNAARFFTLPSEFDIEFYFGGIQNPYMDFISTCVLQGVTVNYSGGGPFLTHQDGAPAALDLTLQFKETEILTKNRIESLFNQKFGYSITDTITQGKG